MIDTMDQQEVTVSLMDVPRVAGNLSGEITEFIPGMRRFFKNIYGEELLPVTEKRFRQILPLWNTFLQPAQGIRGTSTIISLNINDDITKFIPWVTEQRGEQWTQDKKKVIQEWLPDWNVFLQARAGKTLVTCKNLCLTIVGFLFYIVDLGSDIGTAMYYAIKGQWWQAMLTLTIIYGAVIIYTVLKWRSKLVHCSGSADRVCFVSSLLVNFPDVKQYWVLCRLEWSMYKSPATTAHLVPEWHQRSANITILKFTEGVWEACPQAILQLCLLVPDLYGGWKWTDYLRIASASVSLCTAGAALVNDEKLDRIVNYADLSTSELVVLHVWAVPVTACRLLSVALLITVDPNLALLGVVLHLVLRGVRWCSSQGVPNALVDVNAMCLGTLLFLTSPFDVAVSIGYRRVYHAIHFLGNTVAMVIWAHGTPLVCAHPALQTTIIYFSTAIFAVGLVAMELHEKYWPGQDRRPELQLTRVVFSRNP